MLEFMTFYKLFKYLILTQILILTCTKKIFYFVPKKNTNLNKILETEHQRKMV